MKPRDLLKKLNLLSGKTALDVGTRDCSVALELLGDGYCVDAIDIKDCPASCQASNLNYIKSHFEDFSTDKKYDLIIARHIIPFLSDSIEVSIKKLFGMISDKGVVYFTVFGEKDGWLMDPSVKITNLESITKIVSSYGNLVYQSEEHFDGKTYSGSIKKWHIITMVITV